MQMNISQKHSLICARKKILNKHYMKSLISVATIMEPKLPCLTPTCHKNVLISRLCDLHRINILYYHETTSHHFLQSTKKKVFDGDHKIIGRVDSDCKMECTSWTPSWRPQSSSRLTGHFNSRLVALGRDKTRRLDSQTLTLAVDLSPTHSCRSVLRIQLKNSVGPNFEIQLEQFHNTK